MNDADHRYPPRVRAALQYLDQAGIPRRHSAPLLHRLLWRFGLGLPPPILAGMLPNALVMGSFFGITWGAFMWLAFWQRMQMPPMLAAGSALMAGVLFGGAMALYMHFWRRRRKLQRWSDLPH